MGDRMDYSARHTIGAMIWRSQMRRNRVNAARSGVTGPATIPWQRFGDAGLAFFYLLTGVGPFIQAGRAAINGQPAVAIFMSLVGVTALIMAALVLSRRKAVGQSNRRVEQLAAVIGSFVMIPLNLIPLRWDSDRF